MYDYCMVTCVCGGCVMGSSREQTSPHVIGMTIYEVTICA